MDLAPPALTASLGIVFVCGAAHLDLSPTVRLYFSVTPLNYGDGLTFICALLYAVYLIVCDRYASRHDPVALNAAHLAACGLAAVAEFAALRNSEKSCVLVVLVFMLKWCGWKGNG